MENNMNIFYNLDKSGESYIEKINYCCPEMGQTIKGRKIFLSHGFRPNPVYEKTSFYNEATGAYATRKILNCPFCNKSITVINNGDYTIFDNPAEPLSNPTWCQRCNKPMIGGILVCPVCYWVRGKPARYPREE